MRRFPFILGFPAIIAATSCTTSHDTGWPERRPLGKEFAVYEAPSSPDASADSSSPSVEPQDELTLREVLALALMRNPRLAAAFLDVRIGEARRLGAGLLPNPELELEAESALGSGEYRGFDSLESSIRLSQLIELGGKRSARINVAESERRLAGWDHEVERLTVLTEATLGFIDVLAAQERCRLVREIMRLSEESLAMALERVRAGKVSSLEQIKAEIELANHKVELEMADSELRSARKRLASIWGGGAPLFSQAVGTMHHIPDLPAFEQLNALLGQNPEIARWAQEMEQRLAALALERARRIPDLTVGVGVQRFEDTRDHAFAASLSIPLPLFDRNQGGVLEARHRLARLGHERKNAEVRTATALAESYETLTAARAEVISLGAEVVPRAVQAADAAREGYRHGKFNYLDVLDAQRTLFAAKSRLLEAQARCHRSVAVVESLIGTRLDMLHD